MFNGTCSPDPPPPAAEVLDAAFLFQSVSHATALQVLLLLSEGESDSRELAGALGMDADVLSPCLPPLIHQAGLIRRLDGRRSVYALTALGLRMVEAYRVLSDCRERPGTPSVPTMRGLPPEHAPRTPLALPSAARLLNHAAHPLRLQVLLALASGEREAHQLAGELDVSNKDRIRGQLIILRSGSLVTTQRKGRRNANVLSEAGLVLADFLLATYRRLVARQGGLALWEDPINAFGPVSHDGLARLLRAFADPSRLRLLHLVGSTGSVCHCHLFDALPVPRSNLLHSLEHLKANGFVLEERQDAWVRYRLAKPALALHESLGECFGTQLSESKLFESDSERLAALSACPAPAAEVKRTALKPDRAKSRTA